MALEEAPPLELVRHERDAGRVRAREQAEAEQGEENVLVRVGGVGFGEDAGGVDPGLGCFSIIAVVDG